ncbi:MAG TPA: hypothetical protein VHD91_09155 [Gaiellaceae bacterium]|nr:hypothetical protein [Gaiellaceae bacterium]
MNEQQEQFERDVDGWPMPSPDVRRELERRPLSWSEPAPESQAQLSAA